VTRTGKAAEADVAYIDAAETLRQAGHLMRELGVGVLLVRGENGKIQGTISRDMVVRRIAAGGDPRTVTVGELTSRRRPAVRAPGRAQRLWPWPWQPRPCGRNMVVGRRRAQRLNPGNRAGDCPAHVAVACLEIFTPGPADQPLDDAHDLREASPPTRAVRTKRALGSAPVVPVRGVGMPAYAKTRASVG